MPLKTPNHPDVIAYSEFGDMCPPQSELQDIIDSIGENMPAQIDTEHWSVAAHACGDLLMRHTTDPRQVTLRGNRAASILDTIITLDEEIGQRYEETGFAWLRQALTVISPHAGKAILQKQDIPLWQDVALGKTLGPNYENRLEAARQVVNLPRFSSPSILADFMPILLGAREQYQGAPGWSGRLALHREGERPRKDKLIKENWDAGLCFPELDSEYNLLYPMRVQIIGSAARKNKNAYLYRRAGVACISAEEGGFADSAQVILSCLNEFEPIRPPEGMELLHSEQLDAIAQRIEANVREDYELAVAVEQEYRQSLQ